MDLIEQLRVLDAAKGDPAKLALATVDLAYPELHEDERASLKQSLKAAAIPHWCDEPILAALLEISTEESTARLARLAKLTVLEPFRARGDNAINVHEATRLALRKAMAAETAESFRSLSRKMVAFAEPDLTPRGRIEWIYHLLCDDPDRGATVLQKMIHEWSRSANAEDLYALSSALEELEKTRLVEGRARVWTRLVIASNRVERGEAGQLENFASDTLQLAKATGDELTEAEAHCLVGDVSQVQGKLAEARAAFTEYQTIIGRLAEQDRTNDELQAGLAVALNRVGGVLEAQGKLAEAQQTFAKSLEIFRSLVEREPSDTGRRRDLAAAHSRVGGVLRAQGKLTDALEEFVEYQSIFQQLVNEQPTNSGWKQLLARSYGFIGGVLYAQGKLDEALAAFEKYRSLSQELVELEPGHAGWQSDLASAHNRIGNVFQDLRKLTEAEEAFGQYLSISQKLVNQDPTNSEYQSHLAAAHLLIGQLLWSHDKLAEAQMEFEASLMISQLLAEKHSTDTGWKESLATAHAHLGNVLHAQGKSAEAEVAFRASLKIAELLAEQDATNADWRLLLASTYNQMGHVLKAQDKLAEARVAFGECLSISQQLVELDPTNVDWQHTLVLACINIARLDFNAENYHDALPLYEKASRIIASTAADWANLKEMVELELAECRSLVSADNQANRESSSNNELSN